MGKEHGLSFDAPTLDDNDGGIMSNHDSPPRAPILAASLQMNRRRAGRAASVGPGFEPWR
jgi:hypothetical protein